MLCSTTPRPRPLLHALLDHASTTATAPCCTRPRCCSMPCSTTLRPRSLLHTALDHVAAPCCARSRCEPHCSPGAWRRKCGFRPGAPLPVAATGGQVHDDMRLAAGAPITAAYVQAADRMLCGGTQNRAEGPRPADACATTAPACAHPPPHQPAPTHHPAEAPTGPPRPSCPHRPVGPSGRATGSGRRAERQGPAVRPRHMPGRGGPSGNRPVGPSGRATQAGPFGPSGNRPSVRPAERPNQPGRSVRRAEGPKPAGPSGRVTQAGRSVGPSGVGPVRPAVRSGQAGRSGRGLGAAGPGRYR